jgi:hypothetical protein
VDEVKIINDTEKEIDPVRRVFLPKENRINGINVMITPSGRVYIRDDHTGQLTLPARQMVTKRDRAKAKRKARKNKEAK